MPSIIPTSVKTDVARIANGDASALIALVTPAGSGRKVNAVTVSSDDTSARDVSLVITKGGVDYPIGTITIPITAGQIAATPAVNAINRTAIPGLPIDSDGNPYLLLEVGAVLKVKALTTVTSAKFINFVATSGEFPA